MVASTIPLIPQDTTASLRASARPPTATGHDTSLLSPSTPLVQLLPPAEGPSASSEAVVVSRTLPPIPAKLVDRVWRKEYVEMDLFLPSKLGAPEPTLGDLVAGERKKREKRAINSVQEWVMCFNSYMAILLQKEPGRVKDLLAYSSLIVKASLDYEGEAWLSYDNFFRRQAAVEPARYQRWGEIDPSIWTQHFGRAVARLSCEDCGSRDHSSCHRIQETGRQRRADNRVRPYPTPRHPPICKNWNRGECFFKACTYQHVCSECSQDHRSRNCPQLFRVAKARGEKEPGKREFFRPSRP